MITDVVWSGWAETALLETMLWNVFVLVVAGVVCVLVRTRKHGRLLELGGERPVPAGTSATARLAEQPAIPARVHPVHPRAATVELAIRSTSPRHARPGW